MVVVDPEVALALERQGHARMLREGVVHLHSSKMNELYVVR